MLGLYVHGNVVQGPFIVAARRRYAVVAIDENNGCKTTSPARVSPWPW